jgi:membrane fusion protein (multidrug efflux system)
MIGKPTRRRVIGALAVMGIAGAVAGSVGLRRSQKATGAAAAEDRKAPVALEFRPADLTRVTTQPLARWLPICGALQPVNQATVKAKVSGDVTRILVREGERVRAGQVMARIETADLEARLLEKVGALDSAKAQLALAAKTRASNLALLKQNFTSQNAFDSSESSLNVARGSVKSAEAQVQLARNALADAVVTSPLDDSVAKRHVQPGEKIASDAPLVTVVDLRDMALQAAAPAVDVPQAAIRTEAGQTFVWAIDHGRLARRIVMLGRRDDDAGRVEVKTPLPPDLAILAAPFDNLKDGAPALVRAAAPEKAKAG